MAAQARHLLTTGTVAIALGVGASIGAGSAAAADPSVTGGCSTSLPGFGGQPVSLDTGSVLGGLPLHGPVQQTVGGLCGVTAGTVDTVGAVTEPVQRVTAPVTETVGAAVLPAPAAPSAAPGEAAPAEQAARSAEPQSTGPEPVAAAALPPAAVHGPFLSAMSPVFAPSATSSLFRSAMASWSSTMFGTVPTGDLFGYSPDFGILGASGTAPTAAGDVAAAGRATALPTTPGRAPVTELLATLAMTGVLVALVRSWAGRGRLRRS